MSGVLPPNWTVTMLSEVADWSSGGTPKATEAKYYNGDIPWLVIMDLNNEIVTKSAKKITQLGLENSSAKWVDIGSVMVAMYGSIGKLGIAGIKCTTNQAIAFTTRIWGAIPNKYIFYYLQYNAPELLKIGQGGAQKNISQSILKMFPFLLPPLNEQKRIVAKLDAIMPRIDSAKKRLEKIPAILKRFRQSVLTAAVTGKLTEKWREEHPGMAEWEDMILHDVISNNGIFDGPFGSNIKTSDYVDSGVRVIRLENIEHLEFLEEKAAYISDEKYETLLKHTVNEGDIIFSSFISERLRACILPQLTTKAIAKADCFCIRVNAEKSIAKFLLLALVSFDSYKKLIDQVHGATRPRVNLTQLKRLLLSIPPFDEQKEIVRQVDKLFALADKVEEHYQKARVQVDALAQSVLAKAFRGELVPEDPDDEPAEKLLQRIQEEKAKMENELKTVSRSARGTRRNGTKTQRAGAEEKQAGEP